MCVCVCVGGGGGEEGRGGGGTVKLIAHSIKSMGTRYTYCTVSQEELTSSISILSSRCDQQ